MSETAGRSGVALVARTRDVLAGLVEGADGQLLRGTVPIADTLVPHETRRAARFRSPDDRRDYLAGHLLVRRAAARLLPPGSPPVRLVQRCASCGEDGHGRPSADDHPALHLSLSHARGAVAAAAAWSPVGVDIEPRVRPVPTTESLWAATMSAAEQDGLRTSDDPSGDFLRLWVRKEALVKIGAVSLDRLSDVDLSAVPLRGTPGTGSPHQWGDHVLVDWSDDEHVAAVAAAGPVRLEVLRAGR
ncbi:4'-phosphopantetheinyl transferase superfamily protein [Sanguibacter sp. 25GB23B1]|uniref:4'-phosphopantetheinyl transferase family protein n=1 Tax=unclassified Sanguibacter TaxID=2645534 RepID=UPI0032B00E24